MKKWRIGSVVLLLISTAVFTIFKVYERVDSDYVPPVISYPEEELSVSVGAKENELLKGVKAKDDKSGDVSESLVVESISDFTEEGVRTVTYAAIDNKGNVRRKERTLRYNDYQRPQFSLNGPLRYPVGKKMNVLDKVRAESVLDGDLTSNIKYALGENVNIQNAGKYPVEFRVMDSGGNTVYLNTELEMYNAEAERIKVSLKQYIVYLNTNDVFDPNVYYAGANEEGTLEVQSHVDMSVPGVYFVDYIVHGQGTMGKNRLVVVVNEK